jgi:protein-tyrosine phosphatase
MAASPEWSPTQLARLAPWDAPRCVDVHCHCLPGVDDGPATLEESLDLCRSLVADGVTTVIATPHQMGIYEEFNTASSIRAVAAELRAALADAGIPLELAPGADVRIDERLPLLLEADLVLTAADRGRHLLLELPFEVFVDPLPTIVTLAGRNIQTIMTHPERHRYLSGSMERIEAWVAAGAAVQITAGSLLGEFGRRARDEAWRLVHAGLVSLVAGDAHDAERRPPRMTTAIEALESELGRDAARTLCLENPWRVWQARSVEPFRPAASP